MSDVEHAAGDAAPKKGSIVNPKYAGAYKNGGREGDELAAFINDQCRTDKGFDYDVFFALCVKNGVPVEQTEKYNADIQANKHGAQGRARMTLRNLLASIARKQGHLVDLNGQEHPLNVPKPPTTGAARKAQETAAAKD
jgi:hypothetical protein